MVVSSAHTDLHFGASVYPQQVSEQSYSALLWQLGASSQPPAVTPVIPSPG